MKFSTYLVLVIGLAMIGCTLIEGQMNSIGNCKYCTEEGKKKENLVHLNFDYSHTVLKGKFINFRSLRLVYHWILCDYGENE